MTFELEGFVTENKYKNAAVKWKGLPIIVSSNRLPWILSEQASTSSNLDERFDHEAFKSIIKFHKLHKSFLNSEIFPYSAIDLASYLLKIVNDMKNGTV